MAQILQSGNPWMEVAIVAEPGVQPGPIYGPSVSALTIAIPSQDENGSYVADDSANWSLSITNPSSDGFTYVVQGVVPANRDGWTFFPVATATFGDGNSFVARLEMVQVGAVAAVDSIAESAILAMLATGYWELAITGGNAEVTGYVVTLSGPDAYQIPIAGTYTVVGQQNGFPILQTGLGPSAVQISVDGSGNINIAPVTGGMSYGYITNLAPLNLAQLTNATLYPANSWTNNGAATGVVGTITLVPLPAVDPNGSPAGTAALTAQFGPTPGTAPVANIMPTAVAGAAGGLAIQADAGTVQSDAAAALAAYDSGGGVAKQSSLAGIATAIVGVAAAVWSYVTRTLTGAGGAIGPTAAINNADIPMSCRPLQSVPLSAMVYTAGFPSVAPTNAGTSSIAYSIWDVRNAQFVSGYNAVPLTVAAVLSDTPLSDAVAANYNLRIVPVVSSTGPFPHPGKFAVVATLTPTSGPVVYVNWMVSAEW